MTKEEIIRKCLAEFLKKGIRKMTLKDIVANLGISTKTMYRHFADKESLLKACLHVHYDELFEGMKHLLQEPSSPLKKLFTIWITCVDLDFGTSHLFYADLNYYYPALQDKELKNIGKKLAATVLKLFDDGKRQNLFRRELNSAIILEGLSSLYSMLTRTHKFKKFSDDAFVVAENTIVVYLRGLCTAKGLKEIESYKSLTTFIKK